ncbi:hypothetical protein A2U01_0040473 [Trifolium medium]|uniref:Uncharacterized protein n=1 Tax=Trifolium medium TaxID=97028 RepID=A0A392Q600_9FABA|nr:hypothetical protein [Trifolium medium]
MFRRFGIALGVLNPRQFQLNIFIGPGSPGCQDLPIKNAQTLSCSLLPSPPSFSSSPPEPPFPPFFVGSLSGSCKGLFWWFWFGLACTRVDRSEGCKAFGGSSMFV